MEAARDWAKTVRAAARAPGGWARDSSEAGLAEVALEATVEKWAERRVVVVALARTVNTQTVPDSRRSRVPVGRARPRTRHRRLHNDRCVQG